MTDLFLGVIALAVLVMAIIQVAAIVFAARTARRVSDAVSRLERGVQPIVSNLQQVSADVARASASAAAQVERAGRLLDDVATRLDTTLASVHEHIIAPAREGFAFLQSLKSIFAILRPDGVSPRQRNAATDDEDALFIG